MATLLVGATGAIVGGLVTGLALRGPDRLSRGLRCLLAAIIALLAVAATLNAVGFLNFLAERGNPIPFSYVAEKYGGELFNPFSGFQKPPILGISVAAGLLPAQ
ncbi:MAG: hypothetical protein U0572_10070 [Phycisphaerales bacterium]